MPALARRPFIPILIFALFCSALILVISLLTDLKWSNTYMGSIGFFTLLTMALHGWQEKAFDRDPKGFVHRFMLGLVLKLFLSLAVVVCMLFLLEENRIATVLVFAFLYLAFLAFSTARLVSMSRIDHDR